MSASSIETDVGLVSTDLDPRRVRAALRSVIAAVDVSLDAALADDPETGWDTYQDLVGRFIHHYERPQVELSDSGADGRSRADAKSHSIPTPLTLARTSRSRHQARSQTPPAQSHVEEVLGGPVRILASTRRHARLVGLSDAELVDAVLCPEDEWLSPRDGVALVRIHGDCAVIVAADDDTLILSAMSAARAVEQRRSVGSARPSGGSRKPGSGSPSGRRPQDTDALLALCSEHGFDHQMTRGGHYRLTHAEHPGRTVSLPSTPSDPRGLLNSVTTIRSVFGIDVRQHPQR